MTNRIQTISVLHTRLTPVEAELWIAVYPERLTSDTLARGRLMGPRCAYASTVEVAYPLRERVREYESEGVPHLTLRAVIPEPNFWAPASPFLYEGPLELWQGEGLVEQRQLRRGLRSLSLPPAGLRWNGQPLTLRGVARSACTEDEARRLRAGGYNTLLIPLTPETAGVWDLADRHGFLVLGRLSRKDQFPEARAVSEHPSCLGWLLSEDLARDLLVAAALPFPATGMHDPCSANLVGVEVTASAAGLSQAVHFLACSEELLPALEDSPWPRIVLGRGGAPERAAPGVLGWIEIS